YWFVVDFSILFFYYFFFSSRRRHTRFSRDWSSDVFSSDLANYYQIIGKANEIIAAAEEMDMENEEVRLAWAEAKMFRGRSYFERSEERRVGKECRSQWWTYHEKKNRERKDEEQQ